MEGFIDRKMGKKLLAKRKKELFQARSLSFRGKNRVFIMQITSSFREDGEDSFYRLFYG